MAWCLTAPSHYLNHCWLMIKCVLCHYYNNSPQWSCTVMPNAYNGISDHWQFHCLFNSLFRLASKIHQSSILLTICAVNSQVTSGFPSQRASVSMPWCYHDGSCLVVFVHFYMHFSWVVQLVLLAGYQHPWHYSDVIMGAIAPQITSLTTVYSDADQRKHQSSVSLAFVWGFCRGPVNSPRKRTVMRKMFPLDDVLMSLTM